MLSPNFKYFDALHVVLLINCIFTPFLNNRSPYEKLHDTLYHLSILRVFDCLCFSSSITSHVTQT